MKKPYGISLIELVIVLAIVVIITSISMPRLTLFNKLVAKMEIEKMHACFKYLQQRAIIHNKDEVVIFNINQNSYSDSKRIEQLPQVVQFGVLPGTFGPPAQPKQLITQPITFAGNRVTLFASGTISPGTVYLTDKSKSCLYALTCPVSAYSSLRMYSFDQGWKPFS